METVEALANSIISRYIEDQEVEVLHASGQVRELPPGTSLFAEGDPGGSLYVILEGTIEVRKQAGAGEKKLATLHPGDVLGELSLVDSSPRSAGAVATSKSTLFELSRRDLMGILRSKPPVAARILWAILETVALRVRDMNEAAVRWNLEKGKDLPKKAEI